MKKNIVLTFCFSFIPGAGQMYQQYMKRGLSITMITAMFLALAIILSTPIFAIPVFILVMYSFFDTFNIRNTLDSEAKPEDEYIWKSAGLDLLNVNLKAVEKNSFIGISLVLIGVYLIFNNVLGSMLYNSDIKWLVSLVITVREYLPSIIIAAVSIGIGLKFIKSNKEG